MTVIILGHDMNENENSENENNKIWNGYIVGDMTKHIKEFIIFSTEENHPSHVYLFGIIGCASLFESTLEDYIFQWCEFRKLKHKSDLYERLFIKLDLKQLEQMVWINGTIG